MSNIQIIFFPPNTTSKVQPLDQGIIRAFKAYYRRRLAKHIIRSCTLTSTLDQVIITALDSVHWIEQAWKDVTESTIRNTFRTAGFKYSDQTNETEDNEMETNELIVEDPIEKLDALLGHVKIGTEGLSATEYIKIDDEILVFNEWEDDVEILPIAINAETDEDENDQPIPEEPPSLTEAHEMIRKLHLFVSIRQPELHQLVSELESKLTDTSIDSKSNEQSSITDFFKRV